MTGVAYSSLLVGVLCWFFNPFLAFTILAVVNAVMVTRAMRDDWYRRRMGSRRHGVAAVAIAGAVIAALPVVIVLAAAV
jgi:hypothetical protein